MHELFLDGSTRSDWLSISICFQTNLIISTGHRGVNATTSIRADAGYFEISDLFFDFHTMNVIQTYKRPIGSANHS